MSESNDRVRDFREIAHCGGQVRIRVTTDAEGRRGVQFGVQHSRPTAAAWFAIYALPQGIPVGMIQIAGIGAPWNPPPIPNCIPVFVASDGEGRFGHRCPFCRGYWRSDSVSALWKLTCPYCGSRAATHEFLTIGQQSYVREYCRMTEDALGAPDGEYVLDMDEIADAIGRDAPKPKLYYAEESQQNKFNCSACGSFNDILGRYGYCSNCGTFNGLVELEKDLGRIRERVATGRDLESCTKDAVATFDSFARQTARKLAHVIPMTPRRRKEWKRRLFQQLSDAIHDFREVFDIDLVKGLAPNDISFATLMFHRRHVYEHNGGEVDEKYIQDSGDTSVRPKQVIRESKQSVGRLCDIVAKLASNLSAGFHSIFPPQEKPIKFRQRRGR